MRTTSDDLVKLLARAANRESDAFAALYHSTSAKLFGIILRILRQQEAAEEVLQDVYLKIWERASDFDRSKASPITWMATIARNRALDEVRKRKIPVASDGIDISELADPQKLPSEQLEISQELRRLEACLDGLDKQKTIAIKLAYLDGLSRQELAERLDQPVGTIKTWLHRGLKQLKDCLGS
jgi:RNA polymerase sigma-70 factor (ECF subfamily)